MREIWNQTGQYGVELRMLEEPEGHYPAGRPLQQYARTGHNFTSWLGTSTLQDQEKEGWHQLEVGSETGRKKIETKAGGPDQEHFLPWSPQAITWEGTSRGKTERKRSR